MISREYSRIHPWPFSLHLYVHVTFDLQPNLIVSFYFVINSNDPNPHTFSNKFVYSTKFKPINHFLMFYSWFINVKSISQNNNNGPQEEKFQETRSVATSEIPHISHSSYVTERKNEQIKIHRGINLISLILWISHPERSVECYLSYFVHQAVRRR